MGGDIKCLRVPYVIPYHTRDGRLIENRKFDAKGNLSAVIVFIGEKVVGLDKDGNKLPNYEHTIFSQKAFLRSSKK